MFNNYTHRALVCTLYLHNIWTGQLPELLVSHSDQWLWYLF